MSETLLFIGGVADGERLPVQRGERLYQVRARRRRPVLGYLTSPLATVPRMEAEPRYTYERVTLQAGFKCIDVFVPEHSTPGFSIRALVDGYRKPHPEDEHR